MSLVTERLTVRKLTVFPAKLNYKTARQSAWVGEIEALVPATLDVRPGPWNQVMGDDVPLCNVADT